MPEDEKHISRKRSYGEQQQKLEARFENRSKRFQAFFVQCTFESELAQLEKDLLSGVISQENFIKSVARLNRFYGR